MVKTPLFYDALLIHDEELEFDVFPDEFLELDDEVQSSLLADFLLCQQDEYCLLHVDVLVDIDDDEDAILVLLLLGDFGSFDVVLFPDQENYADGSSQFCCRCQSPGC